MRLNGTLFLAVSWLVAVLTAAGPVAGDELSQEIADNTQSAELLRRLLEDRQWTFFGRFEGDIASYFDPPLDQDSGVELRRFRIGIAGVNPWFEHISYKLELDLTDGTSSLSSAYLKFDHGRNGAMTVGNQDVSQNLSSMTGSLSQLFMEEPLSVSAFSLTKRLGVSYDWNNPRSGFHAMYFGDDPNEDVGGHGFAGRAWFNPYRSNDGIWHVGAALVREDRDEPARIRTRPESHVTDQRLVDTGQVPVVDTQSTYSLEIAGASRSGTGRLELFMSEWERPGRRNQFVGAYWEIGYMLTGQPFRYRNGKFVRPLLEAGHAAWEVGLRLSWVDLDDDDVRGGEERNLGLAVNWYPRHNLRGMFNLLQVNNETPGTDGMLAQWRLQFNW